MSRKNILQSHPLTIGQSLSASFNSPITMVPYLDNISYQINITTSDSTGTFAVQGSLDYQQDFQGNVTNAGNWVNLPLGGGTPTVSGANDTILIDMNQVPFNALRLVYTSTVAGTGTADMYVMAKQIGG